MKKVILIIVVIFISILFLSPESQRKASEVVDRKRHTVPPLHQASIAGDQFRAENYRNRYEICDEHHRCVNVTAGLPEQVKTKNTELQKEAGAAKPFLHTPVFQ